ncbi:hypothetical protein KOW79_006979 [Hemibagrus wyckioides]|uniref:Uncharacterized protein n=1 Tax=Hemibagrus wyckioides TaxID=337641 RepID=A0A9D3SMI1_9TELE|nr:hypothetical protein KOW79_006979 [Hemibagrus wyckioides]
MHYVSRAADAVVHMAAVVKVTLLTARLFILRQSVTSRDEDEEDAGKRSLRHEKKTRDGEGVPACVTSANTSGFSTAPSRASLVGVSSRLTNIPSDWN